MQQNMMMGRQKGARSEQPRTQQERRPVGRKDASGQTWVT